MSVSETRRTKMPVHMKKARSFDRALIQKVDDNSELGFASEHQIPIHKRKSILFEQPHAVLLLGSID